ncbi:hypothetical protein [Desulfosporosinus sp. OT]|uniref:hypothetical protein n=1 Tax=Desulfosporosinus sp. OT TaxID=913865 RepID=UPI000223B265|nr:hypothetical protein [Desulfosporosinus sp. OT]EGW38186.1 hypothetical protein DOT_3944 [Desulfosporosinus sp. OT]
MSRAKSLVIFMKGDTPLAQPFIEDDSHHKGEHRAMTGQGGIPKWHYFSNFGKPLTKQLDREPGYLDNVHAVL